MQNYIVAVLIFILVPVKFTFAHTLCNEQPLDLNSKSIHLPQLPLNSVVRIASPLKNPEKSPYFPYYGHGSGVLIRVKGKTGFVLSASHVTAGNPLVLVSINRKNHDQRLFWAKVVKEDKNLDLSLYKIIDNDEIKTSAPIYSGNNEVYQQTLFTVGYPIQLSSLSKAELFPESKLIIRQQKLVGTSKYLGLGLKIKPLVMSDCIESGLSGGPVFDNEGHVFGINHSTDRYRSSSDTSVHGYIVSSSYILKFLE